MRRCVHPGLAQQCSPRSTPTPGILSLFAAGGASGRCCLSCKSSAGSRLVGLFPDEGETRPQLGPEVLGRGHHAAWAVACLAPLHQARAPDPVRLGCDACATPGSFRVLTSSPLTSPPLPTENTSSRSRPGCHLQQPQNRHPGLGSVAHHAGCLSLALGRAKSEGKQKVPAGAREGMSGGIWEGQRRVGSRPHTVQAQHCLLGAHAACMLPVSHQPVQQRGPAAQQHSLGGRVLSRVSTGTCRKWFRDAQGFGHRGS